jgi:hypothetical protein
LAPPFLSQIRPSAAPVLHVRLGAGIRVGQAELTPALGSALRHAASMHKPEFYKRQRMRASTYNIPRFLYSFDETIDGSLVLPRGMLGTIASLAEQAGSWVKITDERAAGTPQQFQVQRDADCSAASGCRRTDPARPRHACRAARLGRGSHPVRLRPVALRNPARCRR